MADSWDDFLGRQLLPALALLPLTAQTCDQSPKLFLRRVKVLEHPASPKVPFVFHVWNFYAEQIKP